MKFNNCTIILFLALPIIIRPQLKPGSAFLAVGSSDVTSNHNQFALFTNPAVLSTIETKQIGVYYSPSPFGMKELANVFGVIIYPFDIGVVSAGYSNYGFELYRENKFSISFSKKLFNVQAGTSFSINRISIKNYGQNNFMNINLGFVYSFSDNFRYGLSLENIIRNQITKNFRDPFIFRAGTDFHPVDNADIFISIYKEENFPISFRTGTEYLLFEVLALRLGFRTIPDTFTAGVGLHYFNFMLNYAVFTHNYLGLSHQFDLVFQF